MVPKLTKIQLLSFAVIFTMIGLAVLAVMVLPKTPGFQNLSLLNLQDRVKIITSPTEEDFRTYVQKSMNVTTGGFGGGIVTRDIALQSPMGASENFAFDMAEESAAPKADRFSSTNVQIAGIDEPDIVKTNGSEIFYSNPFAYILFDQPVSAEPFISEPRPVDLPVSDEELKIAPAEDFIPPQQTATTSVITAFPVDGLAEASEITAGGQLLLHDNTLIIFSDNKITGYNVSDPSAPVMTWEHAMEDSWIDTSRLLDGNIFVVAKKYLSTDFPCPMPLMDTVRIACTSIYHPSIVVSSDTLYTVLKMNPMTGEVSEQLSFTGSSSQSVVYVSPDNMYITYSYSDDPTGIMINFFRENNSLLPAEYQQRLAQLQNYNLSDQARLVEYEQILNEYKATLHADARLQFEEDMHNKLQDYSQSRIRDVEKTSIAKIDVDSLQITRTAEVAGTPLNQFSLDEHNGNLRIVTTVGANSFMLPTESVNDMYVLNSSLETIGSIQNLAKDERVYSARFMGDTAYVVTFKQIDPFFVFDLSNPAEPKVVGELKIPGYSSYLHPLKDNLILGVGREDTQVKLTLFDVSNKSTPTELNTYLMDQTWSEVENNHRAFLQDAEHEVFFIPTGTGGFIFSYSNNTIELVRTIAGTDIQRALFINDYLYVIGRDSITVLNEADWSTISTLSL